jgi:Cu-processing system ATP-binding protein
MIIETDKLVKKFGKLTVIDGLDLKIDKGKCMALIGPNASGKTTLIKSILGLVVPTSGKILFKGKSVLSDWEYRKHIGYMPQIGRYPDNMMIGQLFSMISSLRNARLEDCDTELIQKFKIEEMYSKRMGTLSGGTRQKISACLAFLFNPEVLILDEPTSGLDPVSNEMLKEKIITEKNKGKLILITSHILSDLDDLVDEILFLQDGKIKLHSTFDDLRRETGETKLSKAIARIMGYKENVQTV